MSQPHADSVSPRTPEADYQQQRLTSFTDYLDAQRLVDRMSDDGFPVEHVRVVGHDVRTVEQITGRMTKGRAALAGAGSGAWIGLLIGLFTIGPAWVTIVLLSLVIGAAWGAIFAFVAIWAARGQRDFSSIQTLRAQRYDIYGRRVARRTGAGVRATVGRRSAGEAAERLDESLSAAVD